MLNRIGMEEYQLIKTLNVPDYQNVWVAGDSAYFEQNKTPLRKAVNFAYYGGKKAGQNIVRYCNGKKT